MKTFTDYDVTKLTPTSFYIDINIMYINVLFLISATFCNLCNLADKTNNCLFIFMNRAKFAFM